MNILLYFGWGYLIVGGIYCLWIYSTFDILREVAEDYPLVRSLAHSNYILSEILTLLTVLVTLPIWVLTLFDMPKYKRNDK